YEERFLRAFPMALEEAAEDSTGLLDPERRTRAAWTLRTFQGFGYLSGLVELGGEKGPTIALDDGLRVRATPMLAQVFPHPPPA
ncbi:MAG: hypothetical protein WD382_06660, partial [Halofilum sp. (in: g-proteobacteria)]